MNRGDRLVFSNGIVVLAIASSIIILAFEADLTRLIQLYVIGVFMSFTLSQSGMVVHWTRERRSGTTPRRVWRRSIAINVIGAVATGVVLLVVTVSKFTAGGWLSMLFMGILVLMFLSIHRHYVVVMRQLRRNAVRSGALGVNHLVLVVRELDPRPPRPWARSARSALPSSPVHLVEGADDDVPFDLQERWRRFAGSRLEALPLGTGSLLEALRTYVTRLDRAPEDFVNVVIPEMVQGSLVRYLLGRTQLVRLKAGLLREPNIVVTDVPVMVQEDEPASELNRPLIPARVVALAFVSTVNDATKRAVNYAETLEASETRGLLRARSRPGERDPGTMGGRTDGDPARHRRGTVPDLTRPMLEEVRRFTTKPGTIVIVVMPELIVSKWWQFLLHNQNALFVKRLFLFEPDVILSSVPYLLEDKPATVPAG